MTDRPLLVSVSALKAFIMSVFDRWGTPPAIADRTADLMVRTDLRGVDSHGVGMLPTYQRWHARGWIVPAAEPKVERDEGTTAVVDGQQAFGHYTATLRRRPRGRTASTWPASRSGSASSADGERGSRLPPAS
jgi:LDH2 family malate/lactate/ureidoglycolate dehydrogenase